MVGNLFAVVAVSLAGCEDKPVAHVWYVNVRINEPVAYFFFKKALLRVVYISSREQNDPLALYCTQENFDNATEMTVKKFHWQRLNHELVVIDSDYLKT